MSTLLQRISLNSTLGACLIGAQISAMIYGLTTLQSYFYFVSYPEDSTETKALVCIIWFLDSLHTAFVSTSIYHYLVTNYDNPRSLAIAHWSLFVILGIHILIVCIVQTFFATRIFRLTSSRVRWWLTSIVAISVFTHLCFGIETLALMAIKKEFSKLTEIAFYAAIPYAISGVLCDGLIAGSLCVLLHGSRTGHTKTNTIVTTLIIYAINRCLLTSVVAVVEAIMFSILPHSLWFLAVDFIIAKLYANSLLAALNSRQSIRETDVSPTHLTGIRFIDPTGLTSNSRPKTDAGDIVLDIHAESNPWSSRTQSHFIAKDEISAVAPYKV